MPRPRSPTPLTIVLDENLASERLCAALSDVAAEHDATVEMLSKHFPNGTLDQVWLPEAGKCGWLVVTVDVHIRRRPSEREILANAGVKAFIVRGRGMNGDQICEAIKTAIPAICRRARQLAPPMICNVYRDGRVEVVDGRRRGGVRRP